MLVAAINRDDTVRRKWKATLYEVTIETIPEGKRTVRTMLETTPIATQLIGIAKVQAWAREERVVLIAPAGKHTERSRGLLWGIECMGPRGCGILGRNTTLRDAEVRALDHEKAHAVLPIRIKTTKEARSA